MAKAKSQNVIPIERITRHIYLIRALKVMLDSDLAELYGVTIGRLNEQVSRNRDRFPDDLHVPAHAGGIRRSIDFRII